MISSQQRIMMQLRRNGPARSRDLVAAGLTRSQLSRLIAAGELVRPARGLYALPDYQPGEHAAVAEVARRTPAVVFCLLTALRLHGLTTQSPYEVWIAIGNKAHPPRITYPPLRTMRFSEATLAAGVESRKVEGVSIRLTSVAKTVADCFKFRNKIGLDVALEALREARRTKKASADQLWQFAQLNRVANVMRPYLEAMPVGLTENFASDSSKLGQWSGSLRKNRIEAPALDEVMAETREYVREPLRGAGKIPKPSLSAVFDKIESSNTTEQDIDEAVRWVRGTKK